MKDTIHSIKRCVFTLAGLYTFNKAYSLYAVRHHLLKSKSENFYAWKDLKVFFSKRGEGSPVILLHSLHPTCSSYEWHLIEENLAENHTVYTLDLPGCGRSDKPRIEYTNFLYVSLLKDFIHSNELEDVTVVASNLASPVPIMANAYEPDLIKKMILINPPSVRSLSMMPNLLTRFFMNVMNTRLIGSFIYNLLIRRSKIDYSFTEKYFYNPFHDNDELVDAFFEAGHLRHGSGQYFAASRVGRFLNIDVRYAASTSKVPIKIIEGSAVEDADEIIFEWKSLRRDLCVSRIDRTKELPHLEEPENVLREIKNFL